MRRTSEYFPLKWRVACKPEGQHFFETIAAFNSDVIAIEYAQKCDKFHDNRWEYRVMERTAKGWKLLKVIA